ncbi:hypothetical protein KW472_01310 [Vibrio fluvialis]|nr:hypothetical protein [Vibrio fluvialis]
MINWLYIGFGALVLSFTLYAIWFFNSAIDSLIEIWVRRSNIKEFKSDFEKAVPFMQPDWSSIKRIANTRGLKPHHIYWTIEGYIRDIKTGQHENLLPHLVLIESYLDQYKHEEPFESLPNDIRLHLERIRDNLGSSEPLAPLTAQIKDLLAIHSKENKKAKFYSVGGFFVGIIGILLATYFYLVPLNHTTDRPPVGTNSESTAEPK